VPSRCFHREQEAITVLQQLISNFPRSPLASQGGVQLGQLYYNLGNYQQSIAAYKNVIANFPGSDDAKNALVSLETVYRDMNDINSYVQYANSLPGGTRITASKQDSLNYLAAESVYMRGSRSDAKAAMTRYLQSYPNGAYSSDANYYLGLIADEQGDYQQAMVHFRRVVEAGNVKFLDNALIYTSEIEYKNGKLPAGTGRLLATSQLGPECDEPTNRADGNGPCSRTNWAAIMKRYGRQTTC